MKDSASWMAKRDSLGRKHIAVLRTLPRGDVIASMCAGCLIAAEAFEAGVSNWSHANSTARALGRIYGQGDWL